MSPGPRLREVFHAGTVTTRTDISSPSADAEKHEAPHLDVSVFARGLLDRVVARRATLIAVPEREGQLGFDIHLQGGRETVFFDV